MAHAATGRDFEGFVHRGKQFVHVAVALMRLSGASRRRVRAERRLALGRRLLGHLREGLHGVLVAGRSSPALPRSDSATSVNRPGCVPSVSNAESLRATAAGATPVALVGVCAPIA